jgi:hypothetical protein
VSVLKSKLEELNNSLRGSTKESTKCGACSFLAGCCYKFVLRVKQYCLVVDLFEREILLPGSGWSRVRKTGGNQSGSTSSRWNRSGPVHEPVRFPPKNRAYKFAIPVNRPVFADSRKPVGGGFVNPGLVLCFYTHSGLCMHYISNFPFNGQRYE